MNRWILCFRQVIKHTCSVCKVSKFNYLTIKEVHMFPNSTTSFKEVHMLGFKIQLCNEEVTNLILIININLRSSLIILIQVRYLKASKVILACACLLHKSWSGKSLMVPLKVHVMFHSFIIGNDHWNKSLQFINGKHKTKRHHLEQTARSGWTQCMDTSQATIQVTFML